MSLFENLRYARLTSLNDAMRQRWVVLIFSAITLVFLGFLYGWSILAVPLQDDFGWNVHELSVTFTLSTSIFCVGGVVGAQITKRTAPRFTLWLSAVLIAAGYYVSAQAGENDIILIYVAYGVFVGGASGMAHNAILGCTNNWFPDRVGMSSGALTLGFGMGSLVIGVAVGAAIDALGWQSAYICLGVTTALVLFAGSIVVRFPCPDQELPNPVLRQRHSKLDASDASGKSWASSRTTPSGLTFTTKQMLRCMPFYLTFITSVLLASVHLATMGNAKFIALELGAIAAIATVMVGIVSLGDGIGRLASGLFFDRFGYRISFVLVTLCFIISTIALFSAYSAEQLWLAVVGFIMLGLGFGSLSTVLAAVTNRFYGPENYGANLSVAYLDFVPASVIGPPLAGLIQTMTGSFHISFIALGVLAIAALIAALFIYPPQRLPS